MCIKKMEEMTWKEMNNFSYRFNIEELNKWIYIMWAVQFDIELPVLDCT